MLDPYDDTAEPALPENLHPENQLPDPTVPPLFGTPDISAVPEKEKLSGTGGDFGSLGYGYGPKRYPEDNKEGNLYGPNMYEKAAIELRELRRRIELLEQMMGLHPVSEKPSASPAQDKTSGEDSK